jgi:hypothetical protein
VGAPDGRRRLAARNGFGFAGQTVPTAEVFCASRAGAGRCQARDAPARERRRQRTRGAGSPSRARPSSRALDGAARRVHEAAAEHLEPLAGIAMASQLPDPPGSSVRRGRRRGLRRRRPARGSRRARLAARAAGRCSGPQARRRPERTGEGLLLAAQGEVEAAEAASSRRDAGHRPGRIRNARLTVRASPSVDLRTTSIA